MAVEVTLPTTPREWHKRVWTLTWPVIAANVTVPLVGVADVAVMGRLPEPGYIAAVTMGAAMFSAVYWLFGFLRTGTVGLGAQAFGRGEIDELVAIGLRAAAVALTLGAIIVTLQWPLAYLLFGLFDAEHSIQKLAQTYYHIRIWGAPGLLLTFVQLGVLFSLQRMRDTLLLSIGLSITNLFLDIFFVLGLGLNVNGVAIGTLISEWGAAGFGFWLVHRALRENGWSTQLPKIWVAKKIRALFHVSSNLVLRTFFVQLPFFAGTVLATSLGTTTLAVHGVLMQLFFVMAFSQDGFAHTAETLSGYSYGSRQPQGIRNTTHYCALWGLIFAGVTGSIYWFAGDFIIAFLTTSPDIQAQASEYLGWIAITPLLCVYAFLYDGVFIGTTHIVDMRNAMILAACAWLICMVLTFEALGYHAIWASMSVFMVVRAILLRLRYPKIVMSARA
ncbi:MAG: MATE family efflux transporter [Pseudomonadota bacterium]